MFAYIIYLFKVLNSVKHFINFVVRFFSDAFTMKIDEFIKFLEITRSKLSVTLNLFHKVVCEERHLMLGLHNLFKVDDMSDISND
jgi:hypothetical protein